jgi:PAS domain S-box-containing protein
MSDPDRSSSSPSKPDEQALKKEIARLTKMVTALMDRAERATRVDVKSSDFSLFETAVMLQGHTRSFVETVIENIPATIFVKNAHDRRFVFLNRAGEQLLGLKRADLIGKRADDVFSKEQAADSTARDDEVIRSGSRLVTEEHALETPHNGVRLVTSQLLGIAGENGVLDYILGVVEDVTERKRAEARIAHLARNDSLTDLPNRATFNEHLNLTIEQGSSRRPGLARHRAALAVGRRRRISGARRRRRIRARHAELQPGNGKQACKPPVA